MPKSASTKLALPIQTCAIHAILLKMNTISHSPAKNMMPIESITIFSLLKQFDKVDINELVYSLKEQY